MPSALGLDFGTLSCRALVVDLDDPSRTREALAPYRHGVLTERLPDGTPLAGPEWALQVADDYLDAIERAVRACFEGEPSLGRDVVGIGVDATASSPLPARADGTPLSREHPDRPHAYVKLWKHHRAQREADDIAAAPGAAEALAHYGGEMSCEWLLPKALEVARADPDLLERAERWLEAGDWIVWQLSGALARNACAAGFKGMYRGGWPKPDLLRRIDPRLERLSDVLLAGPVIPPGRPAGGLAAEWARRLGLREGTPVSAATIDAHAGLLGMGVTAPGTLGIIMGTSSCQLWVDRAEVIVPGVMGVVKDGILPGTYAYEAGQPAVGDLFDFFQARLAPGEPRGHEHWSALAEGVPPGSRGVLALDWIHGNRSILRDPRLSAALFGLTLDTRPEEIYRSLLESTAYGARVILETVQGAGIEFRTVAVCGGLARNPLLVQITADVLGLPVDVAASPQAVARGAALYGAMAAGRPIEDLALPPARRHEPNRATRRAYERAYRRYRRLHDHFSRRDGLLRELRAERAAE